MPAIDRDEALRELGRMAMEIREDAGLSLEDVFERTRVRLEYLRGIEHGEYKGFPDPVYVKGFVRTYLSVIGAEELKDEFMSWLNKDSPEDKRVPPANVLGNTSYPTKGFKLASHFWLFVVLFLVMAGTGGYVWYSWLNAPDGGIRTRFTPPQQPAAPGSGDYASSDALASFDLASASVPPAASREPEPAPQQKPVPPYLHIKATGEVWLEVRIGDRVVLSRTLREGNEASWDLPARARIRYGRANMVTVTLNGKELQDASARGTYFYNPDGTFNRAP